MTSPKFGTQTLNIFRDKNDPPHKEETSNPNFRPIGGINLFKKVEQNSKEGIQSQKKMSKRSFKDNTIRNIASGNGSRFRKERI